MQVSTSKRMPLHVKGALGQLVAAGRATASTTDNSIDTAGFYTINIKNEGATELILAIDEDATTTTKPIYVGASETLEISIQGDALHYATASGTTDFKYILID